MRVLRAIWQELIGLFVDDGALAVGLLVWCAIVAGMAIALPGADAGVALLAGCIAILLVNVSRTARRLAARRGP